MNSTAELLGRVGAAGVRYVFIAAPAGFGKSTLVRAFAQLRAGAAIQYHDCHDVPEAALAERVQAGWSSHGGAATLVFDHADAIIGKDDVMDSVRALLGQLAPAPRAIFLSRSLLPVGFSGDAAPHEIVAINHHDLQFDISDLRREFAAAILDEDSIAEIMRATHGWPAAVLFLRRLIRNEEDASILLDLKAPAMSVFHDYVLHEVLRPLCAGDLETLIACATLPHVTVDDVAAALGIESAGARLDALGAVFPLMGYHADATIALHPLLMATLMVKHAAPIQRCVARAIDTHIERGAMVAAARMYLELGRLDEAATALGRAQIDFQSTQPTFEVLAAQLDETVVCASPTLWNIMFRFRRYRDEPQVLIMEAERLLDALRPNKPSPLEAGISASMALLLCEVGEFDRADALCRALEQRALEQGVDVEVFTKMARAVVMSYRGRYNESLALYQRAGLSASFNTFPTSRQLSLEARGARARGRFGLETELHRRHLNLARRSGTASFEAIALAEATFSAWLAGRDDLVNQHIATYRDHVPRGLGYVFNEFFFNLSARPEVAITIDGPLPHVNAYGALIRSSVAGDEEQKIRFARLAGAEADRCNDGLLSILSRVTLSYLEPEQRVCYLRESLAIAQAIESPELSAAIETLAADADAHAGMLEPLARRYRQDPAKRTHALRIDVLRGSVSRDGVPLAVSTGTTALLVALALERKPVSREHLCALLWPDSEHEKAGNALKMCVRRLRSQLDDPSVIDWTEAAYALRADTLVDVTMVFATVDAALCREGISPKETVALRAIFDALSAGRPSFMTSWEWFEPTERRLCNLAHELGVLLATAAFEREDDADCIALSQRLLAADPCDEAAHELRIRLRLRAGDLTAAVHGFHAYCLLLKRELGIEPRAEFQKLFDRSVA